MSAGTPAPEKGSSTGRALGAAMRSARAGLGLSQQAVARRAGVDRSYYGAIERGEPDVSVELLWRVADALELPLSEILRRAGH
jgi:transcriptional regulator with XRE-family HTH domain